MANEPFARTALTRPGKWVWKVVRRTLITLATLGVVVLVLYLFRAPILTRVGRFLVVSDPLKTSDLIYLMGGEVNTRPVEAARLYREGLAPRIAVPYTEIGAAERLGVRPNVAVENATLMQRLGVPRSAIVLLRQSGGSTSTIDDARILAVYAQRHQLRSVIVVTSEFHTRRSRWALRKILGDLPVDIRMAPADDPRYQVNDWWQNEPGMIDCIEEFIKFIHNFTHA
jgi:uncharacterized SAM-binding protein YcdF (DUF218 family)